MSCTRDNSVGLAKRGFGIARRTCCRRVEQVEVASADTDSIITEHTWACYDYSERAWICLHDDMAIQVTDQCDKDRWSAVGIQAAMNNINEWLVRDSSCMFVWPGDSWTMHDTEIMNCLPLPVLYWGQACAWVLDLGWIEAAIAYMDFTLLKGTMWHLVLRDHPWVQSYPSTTFKTP